MIEAKNISYSVGSAKILDGVDATIKLGNITAILGPNGAGKTTLMKCLAVSCQPDSGVINLEGSSISDYSLKALAKKRAVLSQSNPISFPFTAFEIVMMGRNPYVIGENYVEDVNIVREVLESVDAWHLKDRIFPTLSGGEQQRVHLARVLAQLWGQENAYLFLDEPTSAVDLKHQHQIFDLASKMAKERNLAICVIMHDLNLVLRYADYAILMREGRIHASGRIRDVLTVENVMGVFEVPSEFFSAPKTRETHHDWAESIYPLP